MAVDARAALESPHRPEYEASERRAMSRGIRPKSLGGLMSWFLAEWQRELPDRMHVHSVWRGYASANETPPPGHLGGSLSGAPAWTDPFRRLLENRPGELDRDGYFIRPMRAAIAHIAGRDARSDGAYCALYLWSLGCAGGDWRGVAAGARVPWAVQGVVTEHVLGMAWAHWRPTPDSRLDGT